MTDILTFEQALALAPTPQHILLGNGFSIDFNTKFGYRRLCTEADPLFNDRQRAIIKRRWPNIEDALGLLHDVAEVDVLYGDEHVRDMQRDIHGIKQAMKETIVRMHPYDWQSAAGKFQAGCHFLHQFGDIFTINYDLLADWAIHYAEWDWIERRVAGTLTAVEKHSGMPKCTQEIKYLHGAISMSDEMDFNFMEKFPEALKREFSLVKAIEHMLDDGYYPFFVIEGRSEEKMRIINERLKLKLAYDELSRAEGSLFAFGFSGARQDTHIMNAIAASRISHLCVSIFMGDKRRDREVAQHRFLELKEDRKKANKTRHDQIPLTVKFYDSASAHAWGN